MKRLFTFALVMAMAVTGFAQVKSSSKAGMGKMVQTTQIRGDEVVTISAPVNPTRSILEIDTPEELTYTVYDWQSNAGARNFTAVWPDGFAVMCYTVATDESYGDRGTGLAIWDPAVGEWEYTEGRIEDIKTGFGSIARWKENGLVVASHSADECHLFFCENFRNGSRDFSTMVTLPNDWEPTWPSVQCSGPNNDIVHVLATQYTSTDPFDDAIRYWRYDSSNGTWTADGVLLTALDADHMSGGGSNITYFLAYNPQKPNRVSFMVNDAWVDGKVVISEDNGQTWSERLYYRHPGIHNTIPEDDWVLYPRWTNALYDNADNLCVVYEFNGTRGEPGSGSYFPSIGGIGYWSETLPKSSLCIGGEGNVGEPFILDSCYMFEDMYAGWDNWSDQTHAALPEHIGGIVGLDNNNQVAHGVEYGAEGYSWLDSSIDHGSYNSGRCAFATMVYDYNKGAIYAFWSMNAQDANNYYYYGDTGLYFYRMFCNVSYDNGLTWEGIEQVLTNFDTSIMEMAYTTAIPYVYNDEGGDYVWVMAQFDFQPGTFVMGDDTDPSDNYYGAVKVYLSEWYDGVQENEIHSAPMMSVYPNPAQGMFSVNLNYASDVNIYNTVGQLVKSYKNVKDINVNLESGVYFVNANNQTTKVVVK